MNALHIFLLLLLSAGCIAPPEEASEPSFNAGEHIMLGDQGFTNACTSDLSVCSNILTRADGKVSFSYGELVAFGGDFYGTPYAIFHEQEPSSLELRYNDIASTKKLFDEELSVIEAYIHGHGNLEYPDRNLQFLLYMPEYLNLATANTEHFGFFNLAFYVDYHSKALDKAVAARKLQKYAPNSAKKLLVEALFYNAFADHFLTDGFASGHIRAPRVQAISWGAEQSPAVELKAAGVLTKIIHDRDGEVRLSGEHGMEVTNSLGDEWLARCDAQLFWNTSLDSLTVQMPVQAVEASVHEVLEAFETGVTPDGIFAATQYVPFPSSRERPLTQVFPDDMSDEELDAILNRLAVYMRIKLLSGVDREVLRSFTQALPAIMQAFRDDVRATIKKRPELSRRLPHAYLTAYSNIQ